ncbi:MAG: MTH1187 family thiamine-binding protein [Ignisphaera sp.]
MAILVELRVVPVGTKTTSLSGYVAKVIELIKSRGYNYFLSPMGTSIEVKTFDDIAKLLEDITNMLRSEGVQRIVIDIAIDARFDKDAHLESKIRSVEEKLAIA